MFAGMVYDPFQLVTAVVLLLLPIGLFHGKRVRYRAISRDWHDHWPQVLTLAQHTLDFLRAALGTWLIVHAATRAPGAKGLVAWLPLLTQAGTLWLGVMLQAAVCKEPDAMNAPFFYVTPILFFYLPLQATGFAFVLAVALALGARAPAAFFPTMAICLAALGTLFFGRALMIPLVIIDVMLLLPWLLPVLFSRELVLAYRARPSHTPAAPRR